MEVTLRIRVDERTAVGQARRAAAQLARLRGLDAVRAEHLAIIVTELGTNLVKHAAPGGELLVLGSGHDREARLDVLALDRGPGTDNVAEWLRDGYSTSGSPGSGLGAVSRLADVWDVHSAAGLGTAVFARVTAARPMSRFDAVDVAGLAVPIDGEEACGDAWSARPGSAGPALLLADGLGHGADAAIAASEATRVFQAAPDLSPAALMAGLAGPLHATRGAAAAVACLDAAGQSVAHAGVGNIAAAVVSSVGQKGLPSANGIVGHDANRVREASYPWPPGSLIVLHSDGLRSHWSLDGYPGLLRRHPGLVAGILYRDFRRGRDDVSVVVASASEERWR